MTEQSNYVPITVAESEKNSARNSVKVLAIDRVAVGTRQRPLDEERLGELIESIRAVGLLNPITVAPVGSGGAEEDHVQLIAGLHRLLACRRLGLASIACTVVDGGDALRLELAEIDENLVRHNPTPAEHALLSARRAEILKDLAAQREATVSQGETPSKQALRRAGKKTGADAASVRDQARATGESKDKIQRSQKRWKLLGPWLDKLRGTSLDNGRELDALAKLPEPQQDALMKRAMAGERVSARTADGRPLARRSPKSKTNRRELALADFRSWHSKYSDVAKAAAIAPHISAIETALSTDTGQS